MAKRNLPFGENTVQDNLLLSRKEKKSAIVPAPDVVVRIEDFEEGVAIGKDLTQICHDLWQNRIEVRSIQSELDRIDAMKAPYLTREKELKDEDSRLRQQAREEGQYLAESYKDPTTGITVGLRSSTIYVVEDEDLVIKSLKPSERKLAVKTVLNKTALNAIAKVRDIPGVRKEVKEIVVIGGIDK